MTEESEPKPTADAEQEAADARAGAEGATNGDSNPDAETAVEDEAPDYPARIAELNEKLLRAMAELENYRRRAEKERRDTAKFAIAGFARDCLVVLDNLRRGLDTVTKEDREANPPLEALAAGMELTERELIATLERHGIEKIDPMGVPFDYDRHQAMFEVDDPSRPAGTVVEVVQPGYLLNDRLLRPAMVGVAKGGPKPEAAADKAADSESGGDEGNGAGAEGEADDTEGRIGSKA